MKKYNCFSALCLAAALAFTACTQDELTDDTLPDGKYPLEIASATIEAESSVQPWGAKEAQTRVSEFLNNPLLNSWTTYDKFYVKFAGSDQIGTYEITEAGSGTATAVTPVYWQSASTEQTIIAWYAPQQAGTIDLSDQSKGRIYVMRAETKATYNNTNGAVSLGFEHQLAKVRVIFSGGNASKVSEVKIPGYTQCTLTENKEVSTADAQTGYITMYKMVLANTFEATVAPGCKINEVKVNGATATLTQPIIPGKGEYCEIKIGVNPIAVTGGEITEPGDYIVTGSVTETITLNGDGINLTLDGATVNTSGIGINIQSGSPTIKVSGTGNSVTSSNATAIHVDGGATLTIEGVNGTEDKLTATGGKVDGTATGSGNAGAGIGSSNGGNIVIRNISIDATGGTWRHFVSGQYGGSAAIGSTVPGYCGDIAITDAVVNASGGYFAAAIGMGGCISDSYYPDLKIGKIDIRNSVITAKGGDGASAIGFASMSDASLSSAYAGEIYIETTETSSDFLNRLTISNGNYKIGKGSYYTGRMTFYSQDGSGTWPGVTLKASDGTQTSADGIGQ